MLYKNPILLCDYSDPDVILVDDTFYMTASSFNFTPGLPVLVSKNMIDWQLVNYACKKIPFDWYDKPQNAKGIWAPSIRFHNNKFYIFVAMPDEGIFYTETSDPFQEWSGLKCIKSGKGFEDPCPIWEGEKVFLVHGYVKSRIGFNSKLGLLELDPESFNAISEDKIIFDGTKTQPTIEGPKFYKKDDFFYIFAPAGGVSTGWQTVLRSKKIDGDYEERIVLKQGNSLTNGPHQGAWVQTKKENSKGIKDWFFHFQERGIFGRIVHLQPMKWKNGWPLMGTSVESEMTPGEPYEEFQVPFEEGSDISENQLNSEECKNTCNKFLEFQFSANPKDNYATFSDDELTLYAVQTEKTLWKSANVLTKKVDSENFDFECEFDFSNLKEDCRSGMIFLGNEYKALSIERKNGNYFVTTIESSGSEAGDDERYEKIVKTPLNGHQIESKKMNFELSFRKTDSRSAKAQISIKFSEGTIIKTDKFTTENAHWVGGRFGFFATGNSTNMESFVKIKVAQNVNNVVR